MRHPAAVERSLAQGIVFFSMPDIQFRSINDNDREWVARISRESWGSETVIAHSEVFHPAELDGFIATQKEEKAGLVTYRITGDSCEIVTLNALKPNLGIGSVLIRPMVEFARGEGSTHLSLITTNDNTNALRFYQKLGFTLCALRPGIMEEYRKLKPEIPMTGADGIPIRDEIELEMAL